MPWRHLDPILNHHLHVITELLALLLKQLIEDVVVVTKVVLLAQPQPLLLIIELDSRRSLQNLSPHLQHRVLAQKVQPALVQILKMLVYPIFHLFARILIEGDILVLIIDRRSGFLDLECRSLLYSSQSPVPPPLGWDWNWSTVQHSNKSGGVVQV